jgi:hypothetical protein
MIYPSAQASSTPYQVSLLVTCVLAGKSLPGRRHLRGTQDEPEAMAAQVPIVASDCGSVADIVEDGEQGFVVPVRDTQMLGDRLAGRCAA